VLAFMLVSGDSARSPDILAQLSGNFN